MLKIGVFGVGHLGRIHIRLLKASNKFKLIGFYDPDKTSIKKLNKKDLCKYFDNPIELIREVDIIDIVSPTSSHLEMALMAIENKKHVFIEKPISYSVQDANKIIKSANKNNVLGQVGHVERFNPAFKAVKNLIINPMFIESHRLSEFNPRGTDVSVVLDLMIHDIDLVLHMIKSPIKEIIADGINVIANSVDLANTKLIFENGCVVNLTASRISNKDMRKIRVFEKNCYSNIDLLNKKLTKHYANYNNTENKFNFKKEELDIVAHDALQMELIHFCNTIINKKMDLENITKAVEALQIAEQINEIINNKINA